jgi:cell division protein ZapA (FtsZ GTPase activity inhibitor)
VKRKVDVTLLGHRFTVKTDRDESFVRGLASHVGRRIEEVRRSMRSSSPEHVALFAALAIAEELFEERERAAGSRADVRRATEAMIEKLTAALHDGTLERLEPMSEKKIDKSMEPVDAHDDDGEEIVLAAAPLSRQA